MATLNKDAKTKAKSSTAKTTVKSGNTKKFKKVNTAELDKKNLKNTITKVVVSKREVKYKYPEEVGDDQLKRKTFRSATRAKNEKFLAEIADLKRTQKPTAKLEREYKEFRQKYYLVP